MKRSRGVGQQNRQRGGLHAAGCGSGGAADQHQPDHDRLRRTGHCSEINGVEPRSSRRYRLKQRGQQPFVRRKRRKIREKEIDGWKNNQQQCGREDHFALHPVAPKVQPMPAYVVPRQKADATNHDQQHDRDVHGGILRVSGEGGILVISASQNVKAGIAERGNRMKYRQPNTAPAIIPAKHREHCGRAERFDQKGAPQNKPRQPNNSTHLRRRNCILHGAALHQGNLPSGKQCERRRHSHHAQAADLYQRKNYRLSKAGPVAPCVLYHQSRHAYGGGCSKQRFVKRRYTPVRGGNRQRQQQGSKQYHARKAQRDHLKG